MLLFIRFHMQLAPYLANTFLLWKIQNRKAAASVEVDGCAWSSSIWRLHLSLPNQVFVDKTNSRRGNQKIEKQTSSILSFRCSNVTGDSLKNHTTTHLVPQQCGTFIWWSLPKSIKGVPREYNLNKRLKVCFYNHPICLVPTYQFPILKSVPIC